MTTEPTPTQPRTWRIKRCADANVVRFGGDDLHYGEEIPVVELAPVVEALAETEQRLRVAREESDKGNEVTAYSYISTGLNGIRSLLAALSPQNPTPEETT